MALESILSRFEQKKYEEAKTNTVKNADVDDLSNRISCNVQDKITTELIKHVRDEAIKSEEFKASREAHDEAAQKRILSKILHITCEERFDHYRFSSIDKSMILKRLFQTMFGYGPLQPFMDDEYVNEIMVNGISNIFIEKSGNIERAYEKNGSIARFHDEEEMKNVIQRIVAPINRRVDESEPIVDARLPDGSRVNVVLNPVSIDGAAVTIRKFPQNPFSMEQLISFGTIEQEIATLLQELVKARRNIIVSGGTASGKTTFLNAMSQFIDSNERVITIEDSAELKLSGIKNLVRLEARPANIEGRGRISIRELVKTSLRMRPDRIIVGEVRGEEALDMLQAMNTGHDGSLSTGHANSAKDMLIRLETMVLTCGVDMPLLAIRRQIASAVDYIVHLGKLMDGSRKVLQVCEVLGMENNDIILKDIYTCSYMRGKL